MKSAKNRENLGEGSSRLLLPWKLFIIYIISTLLINFIGPWDYSNYNYYEKIMVFVYLLCFLFAYTFAYFTGIDFKRQRWQDNAYNNNSIVGNLSLAKFSIIVAFFVYCFLLVEGFYRIDFDYGYILTEIMAQSYTRSRSGETAEFNIALWIYSYTYIFIIVALTIGLYKYKELKFYYKLLLIGVYVGAIANSVLLVGAQKGIGDIIIIVGSVCMIKYARYSHRRKIKAWQILAFLTSVIGIIVYFASAFSARIALWGISGTSVWGLAFLDTDHWMFSFIPDDLVIGVGIFLYYLTHGYYGLSLCLNLPFVWTIGIGSSFVIRDIAERYLGAEPLVAHMTYPERMEAVYGWGAYANWHTIFPWLASDFSFIGAIIFLALITYVYAISWKEAILKENFISILMFSFLNILYVYIPANNQLFQTKSSLFALIILTVMWFNRSVFSQYKSK